MTEARAAEAKKSQQRIKRLGERVAQLEARGLLLKPLSVEGEKVVVGEKVSWWVGSQRVRGAMNGLIA